jgi:hypothetical protein
MTHRAVDAVRRSALGRLTDGVVLVDGWSRWRSSGSPSRIVVVGVPATSEPSTGSLHAGRVSFEDLFRPNAVTDAPGGQLRPAGHNCAVSAAKLDVWRAECSARPFDARPVDGSAFVIWVSRSDKAAAEVTVKYMVMTYGGASAWEALAGTGPDPMSADEVAAHFEAMQTLQNELTATGELVAAFGLSEPARAQTVDLRDGTPVVSDGPYAETKEFLAGFGIVDVATHERAVELAARFAGVVSTRVELRPVHG